MTAGVPYPPLDRAIAELTVEVPDFPAPGVLFRDLTPVFADAVVFARMVEGLAAAAVDIDVVVGVEARGFLLAAAVALHAGTGVVPLRKAGKLPRERVSAEYALEYGTATLELHCDSIRPGQRVLLVDDVLATGGTLAAGAELIERLGGEIGAVAVVVELTGLAGRDSIPGHVVRALWTI